MTASPEDFSRVDRPPAKAGEYYSRLARWYDLVAGSEKKFIRAGLDLLNAQPNEKVLEIGFGTGYAQRRLIQAVSQGLSVGVDLSPGMARQAMKKIRLAGAADQANLVCSDSLPLPFRSSTFQSVFSSFTLELFDTPQIPILLAECLRVLQPGGRIVVVSLSRDQSLGAMGQLYELIHNRFPTMVDCRPIPVRRLLEENGFAVKVFRQATMWGLPVAIVRASRIS